MQNQILSNNEIDFILKNYDNFTAKEIASKLGVKNERVQYCAYKLGLRKRKLAADVDMVLVREILSRYSGKLMVGELLELSLMGLRRLLRLRIRSLRLLSRRGYERVEKRSVIRAGF